MERLVTTDAQRDIFDFRRALKSIYDGLVQRDVDAMKFLCSDIIPLQKMEQMKTALDLFSELQTRRMIFPPDNVRLVAELLYCIGQHRLSRMLPYSCGDVRESVEGGRSQLHPCRILLHRICEDITQENFKTLKFFCTDIISKSAMEKICSPHALILALEKQGKIVVNKGNLSYLKGILNDAKLEELVAHVDQFVSRSLTGSQINQNVRSPDTCQSSASNNIVANLCVSPQGISAPNKPLSQCIHGAGGHQNTDPRVPRVFPLRDVSEEQLTTGAEMQACQGSRATVDTHQHENGLPSYSMTYHPRGICLIFNNMRFYKDENDPESKQQKVRMGSDRDCELLERLFGEKLDFKVEVYHDLSDAEICNELFARASTDHSNFDCFVCFVLSHGVNGAIYGANGKLVQIKQITSYFRPSSCHSLCGKPKLFFIQACQGTERPSVSDIVTDGPTIPEGGVGVMPKAETIPDEADFLVALATVPGYVSYRSRRNGSWYITTLVKMLQELADRCDLLSILTRVNEELSRTNELVNGLVCTQVAMPMTTLRKQVRFYP